MNRIKKQSKKILASTLTVALSASMLSAPVLAAAQNTPKEEVIYINLNADGSVKEINVVNIFDLHGEGEIVDYGKYASVRNMTTTDEINYTDKEITINTDTDKLYYEGRLNDNIIPWNISIHYYLDGKEYEAEEIAAKSGELKITISVRGNAAARGSFFDDYALQASISLDTEKCKNIVAEGATVANVGGNKQLTYTMLPGKETDITITADVTNFEMDGISINGIPLNLNIEVDDEELMDQITELLDAIEKLDDGAVELESGVSDLQDGAKNDLKSGVSDLRDGAGELHDGVASLKDGGDTLRSGAQDLQSGAAALDEGVTSLNSGIAKIQTALNALNGNSSGLTEGSAQMKSALEQIQSAVNGVSVSAEDLTALTSASGQIKSGIDSLVSGISNLQQNINYEAYKAAMSKNGLDIDSLKQNNAAAAGNLQDIIAALNGQLSVLEGAGIDTTQIQEQLSKLQSMAVLFEGNNACLSGTENYFSSVNENIQKLSEGALALQTNYAEFDSKIGELANKLSGMTYKLSELSAAINTLVAEYGKLDAGITAYTDGVAEIVAGYSQISGGAAKLVDGSSSLKAGTETLYSGTGDLLSGIVEIYDGTGSLKDGTGELDDGVAELLTGIAQLYDGTGELKDGTGTLREETEGMDIEINDKIDELLDSISGGNREIVSFVSEDNTNVNAVQFVIQTESIEIDEPEEEMQTEEEHLNFWQKLLHLFS